jgi:hypothetical protein
VKINFLMMIDPIEKINDLVEVEVKEQISLKHNRKARVEIHIGVNAIYMSFDQAVDFANKINEQLIPFLEQRQQAQDINLQVGDTIKLEDKLGGK